MVTRIAYPFVGDSVGGSHISSLVLIQNLDRKRFEPLIILHELGPLADYLNQKNIPFIHLPIPAYAGSTPNPLKILWNAIRSAPTVRSFVQDNRVNIVHTNDLRMNLTWSLGCIGKLTKSIWHQRSLPKSRSYLWQAIPFFTDHTIAISHKAEGSLRHSNRFQISTIYNPVVKPGLIKHENIRTQLGIAHDATVLIFIGRLVEYKRPNFFIEVVAKAQKKSIKPVHGILLGANQEGRKNDLLQQTASNDLNANIHFVDFQASVTPYLLASNLLIAPCKIEAFGRTLVEAMFAGVPVIAADAGGHQEIIDRPGVGFLCAPNSVDAFVEKIVELEADPALYQSIKAQALDMASKRFSVESHVASVSRIYDDLVKPNDVEPRQFL
ncbi:glycosyltransferase family 4 protein [Aestuariispira ectoiniformans]|uniref:glycosyltransferase family 4 protein n=1 Tax=Aestuariispira ectoiniformans TaxID=2775080 RepID=UPI00223A7CED|nr:glycosyltransferase family 4 protein [Aestuariispira ectoiniformans]